MALESRNESVILDAYERVHKEMLIVNKTSADGTRPDGSFGYVLIGTLNLVF